MVAKHFLLFIKEGMNQFLAGEIVEILEKEIRHGIPESKKESPLSGREGLYLLESRKRGLE
jgi:hypothetical protein